MCNIYANSLSEPIMHCRSMSFLTTSRWVPEYKIYIHTHILHFVGTMQQSHITEIYALMLIHYFTLLRVRVVPAIILAPACVVRCCTGPDRVVG